MSRAPTLAPCLVSGPESTLAPRLVSYETAARYLGIPIGTLRSMVCRKQIPHVRLSSRVVRFELAALEEDRPGYRALVRTLREVVTHETRRGRLVDGDQTYHAVLVTEDRKGEP